MLMKISKGRLRGKGAASCLNLPATELCKILSDKLITFLQDILSDYYAQHGKKETLLDSLTGVLFFLSSGKSVSRFIIEKILSE